MEVRLEIINELQQHNNPKTFACRLYVKLKDCRHRLLLDLKQSHRSSKRFDDKSRAMVEGSLFL